MTRRERDANMDNVKNQDDDGSVNNNNNGNKKKKGGNNKMDDADREKGYRSAPNKAAPNVSGNDLFVRYYRDVCPIFASATDPAAAFADFVKRLETPLLTTFWINDTDPLAETFIRELRQIGGKYVETIPWYPKQDHAWRVLGDKITMRKADDAQPLRQLMIRLTALGIISRQEEVSMIPPLVLEIRKDDRCLDCCAAPGSKTAQCLVALGRDAQLASRSNNNNNTAANDGGHYPQAMPFDYAGSKGFVVANELDEKRSNMLVHQCKRMRLLYPFAVFTNHDARYFPNPIVAAPSAVDGDSATTPACEFFDKVMCDVMCSGDGTLRKSPGLLRAWKPFEAAHLQRSQIQVALRGIHLLRIGGRLAYSTCSMHPIENEAVVSQILLRTNGAVRLVDPRGVLPNLRCDPGLKTWKVMNNDGSIVEGPEAAPSLLHPALFPVPGADYPLEKCMRLLPHHTDGGGFFIALFEKVAPWTIVAKEEINAAAAAEDAGAAAALEAERKRREEAEQMKKEAEEEAAAAAKANGGKDGSGGNAAVVEAVRKKKIKSDYGNSLPQALLPFAAPPRDLLERDVIPFLGVNTAAFPIQNLIFRTNRQSEMDKARHAAKKTQQQQPNEEAETEAAPATAAAAKTAEHGTPQISDNGPLQLVSTGVRDLLLHPQRNQKFRISAAGLRTFVPQFGVAPGSWRIANEAAPILAVSMGVPPASSAARAPSVPVNPRLVDGVTVADILPMINGGPLKEVSFDQMSEELRRKVEPLAVGCVILLVRPNLVVAGSGGDSYTVPVPALRARQRFQLLIDGEDMEGFQCRLGLPPPPKPERKGAAGGGGAEVPDGDD